MRPVLKGSTDQSVVVRIIDSADGTPETGVVYNTSGIDLWYRREGATKTSITEATLSALNDAHSDGGVLHIGDGYYRIDLPDAAVASGANGVMVGGTVTGMIVIGCYVPLVDFNPYDGVRLGLTAIPNVAAGASGGLPLSVDANGSVAANITHAGTAQAGAATTITLASGASSTNLYYYHQLVQIVSGTGAGQVRQIVGYIGSTKVATVNYAWQTNPDNTSVYRLIGDHVPFCDSAGTVWGYNHAGSAIATITATNAISTLIGTPAGADVSTDIAAIKGDTASILADTGTDGVLISSGTAVGQISLTNGIVSAYDHEGAEIAKATNLASVISRIGSFTETGANTILRFFKALMSKTATLPSDVGGTFDPATDSTEALRDRGDAAWTTGTTPPTAAAIADAVCDEAVSDHTTAGTVGAQLASIYVAQIDFSDDEANTQDEYSVQWFKNGAPITSGVTSPTIQVIKRADGTDLVASVAMSEIGSTGAYKYDATAEANRITDGEAVVVQVQATIDGSTRTWRKLVSRDASA